MARFTIVFILPPRFFNAHSSYRNCSTSIHNFKRILSSWLGSLTATQPTKRRGNAHQITSFSRILRPACKFAAGNPHVRDYTVDCYLTSFTCNFNTHIFHLLLQKRLFTTPGPPHLTHRVPIHHFTAEKAFVTSDIPNCLLRWAPRSTDQQCPYKEFLWRTAWFLYPFMTLYHHLMVTIFSLKNFSRKNKFISPWQSYQREIIKERFKNIDMMINAKRNKASFNSSADQKIVKQRFLLVHWIKEQNKSFESLWAIKNFEVGLQHRFGKLILYICYANLYWLHHFWHKAV